MSDFHPHELKVKICFGLVTVQGQHEKDFRDVGDDVCNRWGHEIKVDSSGHTSRFTLKFKRTSNASSGHSRYQDASWRACYRPN